MVASAYEKCESGRDSILYVRGRNGINFLDDNGETTDEDPLAIPTDLILKNTPKLMSSFSIGYLTNNFQKFSEVVSNVVGQIFPSIAPDKKGVLPKKTRVSPNRSFNGKYDAHLQKIPTDPKECSSKYVNAYEFRFDYRQSLDECANKLYKRIEELKGETRHDKITLIGRCMGTGIVMAYLIKYGFDSVGAVILYNAGCNGCEFVDTCFTGSYKFEADTLKLFADRITMDNSLIEDDLVLSIISYIYTKYVTENSIKFFAATTGKTVENCAKQITPQIERVCLGLFPGYWSMLSPDLFYKAIDYIYPGKYKEEYKDIIDMLTFDHEHYQVKMQETLLKGKQLGLPIHMVVKYGFTDYPIAEASMKNSDLFISAKCQSFGATAMPIDKIFSLKYLLKSKKNKTLKFISPDLQIDASTALFPQRTWFVKDDTHGDYPALTEALLHIFRKIRQLQYLTVTTIRSIWFILTAETAQSLQSSQFLISVSKWRKITLYLKNTSNKENTHLFQGTVF